MISNLWVLIACATVTAVGVGVGFVSATTTAFRDVKHHEIGTISGTVNTAHELGGALGVAIFGTIAASVGDSTSTGYAWALGAGTVIAITALIIFAIVAPKGRPAADAPTFVH